MTPDKRRQEIINRQIKGNFSDFQIIQASGYQGYRFYKCGTDAGDTKVYAVEQALDMLEDSKAN